jgi:hypothetical protein
MIVSLYQRGEPPRKLRAKVRAREASVNRLRRRPALEPRLLGGVGEQPP